MKDSPERGVLCGVVAANPVHARRIVFVSVKSRRLVLSVSMYTLNLAKLPDLKGLH